MSGEIVVWSYVIVDASAVEGFVTESCIGGISKKDDKSVHVYSCSLLVS